MATTRHKGSNIYLGVALHGGTKVNFAGPFRGLSTVDVSDIFDTREIPGGGTTVGSQVLNYKEGTMSFEVDDNEHTHEILFGRTARRLDIEFGPQGNAVTTGNTPRNPKWEFQGIATITHTCDPRGVRRHSVSIDIDGLITRGSYT